MTDLELTSVLAERVLSWRGRGDRFIKPGRSWIPRWRFQPLANLGDAFVLLDRAGAQFSLTFDTNAEFMAIVQIAGTQGQATGTAKARAITMAVARALGLEP